MPEGDHKRHRTRDGGSRKITKGDKVSRHHSRDEDRGTDALTISNNRQPSGNDTQTPGPYRTEGEGSSTNPTVISDAYGGSEDQKSAVDEISNNLASSSLTGQYDQTGYSYVTGGTNDGSSRVQTSDSRPAQATSTEYETISNPKKFFKKGRVFKTPWSEPAGNVSTGQAAFVSSNDGQEWYTKPRRFVVVREESNFSLCLSLNTHKGQGMTKAGINTHDYAAVYAVGKEDKLTSEQKKMSKKPFPIVVEASDERVESTSHINLGRVYTVEHNSKVKKVGRIDSKHLGRLDDYFVDRIVKKGKSSTSMQYNQENAATANAMESGYGQQPDPQYMRSNDNTTPDSGSSMYAPLAGQPASLPGYMSGSTADTTRDSGQYKVSYTVPANSSTYYQHSSSPQTTGDTRSGYEAAPPRSYYEQSPAPYYVAQSNQEAVQNSSYGNYTTSNYGYNSQGSSLPGSEGNFTNYEHTEAPSSTSVPNHQRHDERNPKDRTEKRYRR